MNQKLSELAIRFEKANRGMLLKELPNIKKSKIKPLQDRVITATVPSKITLARKILNENRHKGLKELIAILAKELNIDYNAAGMFIYNLGQEG